MQNCMVIHFTAVKRILWYLKGIINFGLSYHKSFLELEAFSDAEWAGDPNDRRSTTGLVVFIGSNPISWSPKKQHIVSRHLLRPNIVLCHPYLLKLIGLSNYLSFLVSPLFNHRCSSVIISRQLHCPSIQFTTRRQSILRMMFILLENASPTINFMFSLFPLKNNSLTSSLRV